MFLANKTSSTAPGEEEVHLKLYLDHSEHYPALVKPLPQNVPDLQLGKKGPSWWRVLVDTYILYIHFTWILYLQVIHRYTMVYGIL